MCPIEGIVGEISIWREREDVHLVTKVLFEVHPQPVNVLGFHWAVGDPEHVRMNFEISPEHET